MADALTEKIIAAAIEVHRILGPGLKRALLINFAMPRLIDGVKRLSL